ncbi:sensor histidine kinase [Actinomadura nitritigenes]|uniref:sensor histidine kinase n=1 Tax=Actinomadura nitritigenes TaxID=134602 RepID=UPI003D92D16C
MSTEGSRRVPAVRAAAARAAAWPHAVPAAGLLLGLAAVAEAGVRFALTHPDYHAQLFVLVAAVGLALGTTLPVAFLPPAAAAAACYAAAVLSLTAFRTLTGAGACATLIALYRLGRLLPPRPWTRLAASAVAVPFAVTAIAADGAGVTEVRVLAVLLASLGPAAAWAGIADRAQGEARRYDAARKVIAETMVAHTARGERARIARELHDVVAHHISMVVVRAETARLTTPGMPPAGAERLMEISETARTGLTEMRRLLGVLREDSADAPERHPQPGLQDLNTLVDDARSASGAGTRLIVSGPPAALEPGTELAAYRIVQEALTNARRHAPGAAVDVELRYTGDMLRLRVRDDGPGLVGGGRAGGHGLHGMRERAASVGGELRLGSAGSGGLLIEADLPVKPGAPPVKPGADPPVEPGGVPLVGDENAAAVPPASHGEGRSPA